MMVEYIIEFIKNTPINPKNLLNISNLEKALDSKFYSYQKKFFI